MTVKQFVVEKLSVVSGRKINRWVVTVILSLIGAAIVVAFWRWAFGIPFPPMPMEGVVIAALPYIQSIADNVTRSWQHANTLPGSGVNPHGGPSAP